jgi:hypothetical protein
MVGKRNITLVRAPTNTTFPWEWQHDIRVQIMAIKVKHGNTHNFLNLWFIIQLQQMILIHMPSILSTKFYMKEGLMYLMMTFAYHFPKTMSIGCDELCWSRVRRGIWGGLLGFHEWRCRSSSSTTGSLYSLWDML